MTDLVQAVAWHRQVAALVEAADRAGVATDHLPLVRARLRTQQARLTQVAASRGSALPALVATPGEIASAAPALGDLSPSAVQRAMHSVLATLDAVDAIVAATPASTAASPASTAATSGTPDRAAPVGTYPSASAPPHGDGAPSLPGPGADAGAGAGAGAGAPTSAGGTGTPAPGNGVGGWRAGGRNALVYGGYSFAVLVVQLVLLAVLDEETELPLLAPVCLVVLPAFAWLAGWLTVRLAVRTPPGAAAAPRTPRLGAVICLLPNAVLCAGVGVLFLAR